MIAVQNFGDADGLVAVVIDGPDDRALHDDESDDPAGLAGLALDAQVVEPAAIPQRHEVAVQRLLIEPVAALGKDQRLQCVLADAARATKLDGLDDILRRLAGRVGRAAGAGLSARERRLRRFGWSRRNVLKRIRRSSGCCWILLILRGDLRNVSDKNRRQTKVSRPAEPSL